MDNAATKGSTLVWVKVVAREFATSHTTDGMDKVVTVEIFEPILVRIVGVGTTVKVVRRRIFPTLLVTSIL